MRTLFYMNGDEKKKYVQSYLMTFSSGLLKDCHLAGRCEFKLQDSNDRSVRELVTSHPHSRAEDKCMPLAHAHLTFSILI